eukprot:5760700-Ditylum_brightwellii.AAC.1
MPPPPLGTKEQRIEACQCKEEEEDLKHLNALKEIHERVSINNTLTNNDSEVPVLLPECDPELFAPISLYQRADWDETYPKTTIGSVMKGSRNEERCKEGEDCAQL